MTEEQPLDKTRKRTLANRSEIFRRVENLTPNYTNMTSEAMKHTYTEILLKRLRRIEPKMVSVT